MRSIDTNIVVRLLLRDDAKQVATVDALVAEGNLLIPHTVLIETEWVLRSVYRFGRPDLNALLLAVTGIDGIHIPNLPGVLWALNRYSKGADFADMIHIIASDAAAFATFDAEIGPGAGENCPIPVISLA